MAAFLTARYAASGCLVSAATEPAYMFAEYGSELVKLNVLIPRLTFSYIKIQTQHFFLYESTECYNLDE